MPQAWSLEVWLPQVGYRWNTCMPPGKSIALSGVNPGNRNQKIILHLQQGVIVVC